jgi:N-acetylneuraminic acid mutarotase
MLTKVVVVMSLIAGIVLQADATDICETQRCIYLPFTHHSVAESDAVEPSPESTASTTAEPEPTTPTPWASATPGRPSASTTATAWPTTTASTVPSATTTAMPSATTTSTATSSATSSATSTAATPSATKTTTATTVALAPSATPTVSTQAPATQITWTKGITAPRELSEAQAAVVKGKLYVFGGYTDTTFVPRSSEAFVYDPATQRWSNLAKMPRPITHAGIAVDGDNIYLAGGVVGNATGAKIDAINEVWRYNVVSNSWSAMPPLPEPRGAGELALVGRNLHYFGGTGLDRYVSTGEHWSLALDGGTKWQTRVPLPNPRNHLADAVVDGKLYVIGGQHGHNETLVTQRSVHMWDPQRPTVWTEVAKLPAARSHIGGGTYVVDGAIYVVGGEIAHTVSVDTVFVYQPAQNTWRSASPLPVKRHSGVGGLLNGKLFYTTGSLTDGSFWGTLVK